MKTTKLLPVITKLNLFTEVATNLISTVSWDAKGQINIYLPFGHSIIAICIDRIQNLMATALVKRSIIITMYQMKNCFSCKNSVGR